MRIAIIINGTRGDVQPMLALSEGLIKKGHQITLCAPPGNDELISMHQVHYIPFGPNYREIFKNNSEMKGGATKAPSPRKIKEETAKQIDQLPKMLEGTDLILGVGFVLGAHTVADILKIPYRFVVFYPVLLGPSKSDSRIYRTAYNFGMVMTNVVMKRFINKKRSGYGLTPIRDVWRHWMGEQVIVACDKELNPVREGIMFNTVQTAYMLLPTSKGLPEQVEKFIRSGKPPIYIGFGSNPIARPESFGRIFNEVAQSTGQRLIVSKGWAGLPEVSLSPDILYTGEVSFDLLFPKLAAVVHHGGSGTMASAARAGIPQIAFPFMSDQFENRKQIVKLGLGPDSCDFKKLTASALIRAIDECFKSEKFRKNAAEMATKLQHSDGVARTIEVIESL